MKKKAAAAAYASVRKKQMRKSAQLSSLPEAPGDGDGDGDGDAGDGGEGETDGEGDADGVGAWAGVEATNRPSSSAKAVDR